MARLQGKVAIVTGATSGIGKATVDLFRAEGATVVGADVAAGADVVCDAGNGAAVKTLIDRVAAEHGGLDIIFANGGISGGFVSIAQQTAAQQLSGSGIRVNAICPGLIETGMTQPIYAMARERGQEDRLGEINPLGRGEEPEEIAKAALFLASEDSSYINGAALVVDGGLSSSHPTTRRFDIRML